MNGGVGKDLTYNDRVPNTQETRVCGDADLDFKSLSHGQMVELVYTVVSKATAERREGSSPSLATNPKEGGEKEVDVFRLILGCSSAAERLYDMQEVKVSESFIPTISIGVTTW